MSQRHAVQDATGVVAADENGDVLILVGKTADKPGSVGGYSPGAIFIATEGGKCYVNNTTSLTSANFVIMGSVDA